MKIWISLFTTLFFLSACHSTTTKNKTVLTSADTSIIAKDSGLVYLLQNPTIMTEKPPLFILMHGYGSNEQDLWDLRSFIPKNFMIVSLRAPITLQDGAYEWYGNNSAGPDSVQLEKSKGLVLAFIHQLYSKNPFDTTHIFLGGFSQGANMSYAIGLTHSKMMKGIAVFSGNILPSIYSETKTDKSFAPLSAFVGHGDQDDRIDYKKAQSSVKYIQSKKAIIDFHTYTGMRHQISDQELADFQKWLTAQ